MAEENKKLFPRSRFPFSLFENVDDDWDFHEFTSPSGLSVSEDAQNVFIEAALPGIKSDEIDLFFDKGILWIKAEKKRKQRIKRKNSIAKP